MSWAWLGALLAGIGYVADATPAVRTLWRWALERDMDLTITKKSSRYFVMYRDPQQEAHAPGQMWGLLTVRFVNHSRSHKERIIGAYVALKRPFLYFWRKTLTTVPVYWHTPSTRAPFTLDLEPMAGPIVADLEMGGDTGDPKLYPKMELVLVFEMVGPIRRMQIPLEPVTHNQEKGP